MVRTCVLALLLAAAGGCSTQPSPAPRDLLLVSGGAYTVAFDAALEAARREGMPAALRDRRGGLIVSEHRIAASLLEPWDTHGEPFGQTLENTIAEQRRRVRFEFVPAGTEPREADDAGVADFRPPVDLTAVDGDLEMHVRVFLERAYQPGRRRSTWTRQRPSRTQIVVPGFPETVLPARFWTPVSRDRAAETRLLEAVDASLAAAANG